LKIIFLQGSSSLSDSETIDIIVEQYRLEKYSVIITKDRYLQSTVKGIYLTLCLCAAADAEPLQTNGVAGGPS
jgi:hypothetical protein